MEPLRVDVWSDVACPWCLLGNAHLRKASDESGIPVEVTMHSFQLSPDLEAPVPVREYLERKYGDAGRIAAGQERLRSMGAVVGLSYDFDHAVAANTFDAHRLHHFARSRGRGDAVMDLLLEAQHTQGKDVSDRATLQAIGEAAGLPADDVEALLSSDGHAEDVRADVEAARQLGIGGVPFFVFDRRLAVSGAQPVDVFQEALRKATEHE